MEQLAIDDYLYVNGEEWFAFWQLRADPDDDCQFYQVAGQRLAYFGTSPLHVRSIGEPMIALRWRCIRRSAKFAASGMPVFTLDYRNDGGGPTYGKDSAAAISSTRRPMAIIKCTSPMRGARSVRITLSA